LIDKDFPVLDEHQRLEFPAPNEANEDGIIAAGGNLSPGMLLSAYSQGAFPWYSGNEPILWWNPDPRCVLYPEKLHVSKRMKRTLRNGCFIFRSDTRFADVIRTCAGIKRRHEDGTWINPDIIAGYTELHALGWAHSIEAYMPAELVPEEELPEEKVSEMIDGIEYILAGGLYGISLGRCFFGESMFSNVTDASKAAFISMVGALSALGIELVDCQIFTPHLASLGAEEISRKQYMSELDRLLDYPDLKGHWKLF